MEPAGGYYGKDQAVVIDLLTGNIFKLVSCADTL